MYVEPNTSLWLFGNIPLDNKYAHTIWFENITKQREYFMTPSMIRKTFTEMTYQRKSENVIRVSANADTLRDVNYLCFRNISFSNKYFYAFVNDVKYINNECTEITYEIDVLQTWAFDYVLRPCWVDREHTDSDGIGEHLIPENLECGELLYVDYGVDERFRDDWSIVVCATFNENMQYAQGSLSGGVYCGLRYNIFSGSDKVSNVNNFLRRIANENKTTGVVSLFMIPTQFASAPDDTHPKSYKKTLPLPDKVGGYEPKNNKLLTYPYNYVNVTDNNGRSADFRYEYFDGSPQFSVEGVLTCNPEFQVIPLNYKGMNKAYNHRLVISDMPQCAYNIDTFVAWLAQNKATLTMDTISAFTGGVASALSGNIGGVVGSAQTIGSKIATIKTVESMPNQAKGKQTSSLNIASGIQGFNYYNVHITYEFAKTIDDYFTAFGYKCNRIKVPNIHARKWFTFTKTDGCCVGGSIPQDDAKKISKIFDSGVTFWAYRPDFIVGDYSKDNLPIA